MSSITEARAMTARELFQAETMIWADQRIERRAKLEADADAAHRDAVRRMTSGRR